MDILKMIAELRAERELVEEAMMVLERLALGGAKRRGRPPKWMSAHKESTAPSATPKRVFSAATRKRMALAQGKRWATSRKKKAA